MNQNPWEVSLAEHQANGNQFAALGPQNGRIDGNSARTVLMKSNLPPQILAQIWTLADIDCDGMLDLREFSIAMRLTRNCLAGLALPTTLPPSLLTVPALSGFESSVPMGTNSNGMNVSSGISSISYGTPLMQPVAPVYNTFPIAIGGIRNVPITAGHSTSGKQCGNWTIPYQTKLRYSQQFNQLDKQRMGFLSGSAGRSAMGMSGLPTPTLAHIWSLSDVNKDGRLSVDEFCIAMHLIDMCKAGFALPDQTPAELAAICGISRSANNSPQLEPGAPPAQKSPALKTFEDKRMDNFARGQAELERRRQILIEEENRRRAEVEKREREEEERRAREQLEKERQRRLEKQAEIGNYFVHISYHYWFIIIYFMVKAQKQQEAERTAQRQQRQKTLGFQLQALDEKAKDTDIDITKARKRITEITKEIETMRDQRDDKMRRIAELQSNNQQKRNEYNISRKELIQSREKYRKVLDMLNELQVQAREELYGKSMDAVCLNEKECDGESDEHLAKNTVGQSQISKNASMKVGLIDKHGSFGTNSLPQASASGTTKYRALFEFTARSEDELSFQPGDVVLVFEAHAAEPGWKAGQIRDKVGWFPEAFAEPIGTVLSSISQPIQNMPPNMTPSPSLDRIPEETSVKSSVAIDVASAPVAVICHCVAQFPWKARNDGDLSFSKGDPIEVSYSELCKSKKYRIFVILRHLLLSKYLNLESFRKLLHQHCIQIIKVGFFYDCQCLNFLISYDQKETGSDCLSATAIFDYDANQTDELSFRAGDIIKIMSKVDSEWWSGYRVDSPFVKGLFPANYVQLSREKPSYYYGTEDLHVAKFERGGESLYNYPPKTSAYDLPPGPSEAIYDFPPTWQNTAKFHKLVQELHSTEVRYLSDLKVAKKLFYDTLIHAVSQTELDSVFLNWDQLIEVSTKLITRMERNERPGMLFIAEIDSLSAFVFFCSHQKAAIEALQLILQKPDGERMFLHSGVLYKQRSGRLLVGLLFNDFLMLTTPDGHIDSPEAFKVTKATDIQLCLYKQPLLLSYLSLNVLDEDETTLSLKFGDESINLRCVNRNAHRLWFGQLEQAIDLCAISLSEQSVNNCTIDNSSNGRLLVEIIGLRNIFPKILGQSPHLIRISLGKAVKYFDINVSEPDLHITTQLPISSTSEIFMLALFKKKLYSQDILILDEAEVPLTELVTESLNQRGPLLKSMLLRKDKLDGTKCETVLVKFVVQMFDSPL
uniref:Intersectin-1 n=1 Tax=Heterorhabditis bacteriophora TaxID=37862 RepID=A0A1I7X785_HETBA